ncbi:MAG: hypothetical protein JW993_07105 [Sedimentisphaerales bacterium]|nr:hypothetical protein [Sedimentisphaerales bacterium]
MSMSDEQLEILIGKSVDGEITPAQKRLLEEELSHNREATALLEHLQILSAESRAAVAARIGPRAGEAAEVFSRAWDRHGKSHALSVVKLRADGRLRFAVGLAAGFLLGLVLHFVLISTGAQTGSAPAQPVDGWQARAETEAAPATLTQARLRPVIRNVDWYGFTDESGNQWLVEGVREGMIRPAAYQGELR